MKYLVLFFLVLNSLARACQCPQTTLSLKECEQYEIIFKGTIKSIKTCDQKFGEAMFEVQELYKGAITQTFKVLFDCNETCAQKMLLGEEWIIYTRYKQVENAKLDWCSRSRKFFKVDKEDYYTVNYGNDYYDEVKFLREKLGTHRFLTEKSTKVENRNKLPNANESIIILLASLAVIVGFYFVFNRYFK